MDTFHLTQLDGFELIKVIKKVPTSSFFYLYQTCKGLHDFLTENKKEISYFIERRLYLNTQGLQCGWAPLNNLQDTERSRIAYLEFPPNLSGVEYDRLITMLKTYQITVEHLVLTSERIDENTKVALLNFLKPCGVVINCERTNLYNLFIGVGLNSIELRLNLHNYKDGIYKVVREYQNVKINYTNISVDAERLTFILEILRQEKFSKLRKFTFKYTATGIMPRKTQLQEMFPNTLWFRKTEDSRRIVFTTFYFAHHHITSFQMSIVSLSCGSICYRIVSN